MALGSRASRARDAAAVFGFETPPTTRYTGCTRLRRLGLSRCRRACMRGGDVHGRALRAANRATAPDTRQ
ncbi:hypothetical protein AKJ09_10064 [Labilithrix luteola]|uniref:Uncharacterized protein n=1 Tax=Labilithrix luteola TaxID=1391654 RepID=A0A0K1QC92_9BACT|nr:hypothetical protein AKJ09_10064 [Labilithrix luteola]